MPRLSEKIVDLMPVSFMTSHEERLQHPKFRHPWCPAALAGVQSMGLPYPAFHQGPSPGSALSGLVGLGLRLAVGLWRAPLLAAAASGGTDDVDGEAGLGGAVPAALGGAAGRLLVGVGVEAAVVVVPAPVPLGVEGGGHLAGARGQGGRVVGGQALVGTGQEVGLRHHVRGRGSGTRARARARPRARARGGAGRWLHRQGRRARRGRRGPGAAQWRGGRGSAGAGLVAGRGCLARGVSPAGPYFPQCPCIWAAGLRAYLASPGAPPHTQPRTPPRLQAHPRHHPGHAFPAPHQHVPPAPARPASPWARSLDVMSILVSV